MSKTKPILAASPELHHGLTSFRPGTVSSNWRTDNGLWNIGYTLAGTAREILPQGETWERPHDFMFLKPGGAHSWEVSREAAEPWQVVFFVFRPRPEWAPLLELPEEFPLFSRITLAGHKHDGKIRRALLEAHRLASQPARSEALAMNAIERSLLWLQVDQASRLAPTDHRVQTAMDIFMRQLDSPPSIPSVATACGLSPSRLGYLFRVATGSSPQAWLERARLERARILLRSTGLPVKQIAAATGYNDQRHFATRFRRLCGASPTQCREGRQEE
ncbi:MAG: helix-turn-helix domain-containing protein [Kiritimatiellae bacterium]|nr:helix-turn-helix domain-containing protein [Kiritimatiellia bacterium]